jgi:ubiquinone/menaquinone biosynthesis C-methylase UbiE
MPHIDKGQSLVSVCMDLALDPSAAFDVVVKELADALARSGIDFAAGPNGHVREHGFEVGRVISWKPGEQILMQWRPADWLPEEVTEIELLFEKRDGGTRVTLKHRGWNRLIKEPDELAGWFAGEVAAPILRVLAPGGFGDWVTDRRARRPSGSQARSIYRDPLFHYPNFRVILAELALTQDDHLLEVGFGGGALLKQALQCGCRAAAIDHSPDMVRLAQEVNRDAVAESRLQVRQASADQLPFPDATFTCAIMTGVLGFLPDPLAAFREIRRVLRHDGRFVALGSDPRLKGTPGAPEPMASRLRFYEDGELERLARDAGFEEARVVQRELGQFAREAGVPQQCLALFDGATGFLLARKR